MGQIVLINRFVKSFNRDSINILGGEPSLNNDFFEIISHFITQSKKVTVFTNGNISNYLIDKLKFVSDDLQFCVNRSHEDSSQELINFYKKIGYRVTLSVTIYEQNQSLNHIIEEINFYRLNKWYRMGIALPNWPDKSNQYIKVEEYTVISNQIIEFVRKGLNYGIRPSFDCGFPFCFFSEEQKMFLSQNDIDFKSNCSIIPDICHDNTIIPCFPLKNITQKVSNSSDWEEIRPLMENRLKQFKKFPLFQKCDTCVEINTGNCSGGCAAFRLLP